MIATKPSFVVLEVKACDMQRSGHAGLGFPDANSESPAALIHVSVDMCETCSGKCDESKRLRIERNTYMNVNSVCHTHKLHVLAAEPGRLYSLHGAASLTADRNNGPEQSLALEDSGAIEIQLH